MKNKLWITFAPVLFGLVFFSCQKETVTEVEAPATYEEGATITISKEKLQDKIKGGWAGQVIGCTYGGPTEFRFNGTMIGDEVPIPWD